MKNILFRRLLFLIFPALSILWWASFESFAEEKASKTPTSKERAQKISQLIRELDDDDFQVRENAEKALVKIGKPALDSVREATKSRSPEVQFRAKRILPLLPILEKYYYIDFQKYGNEKIAEKFDLPSKLDFLQDESLPTGEQLLGNVQFRIDPSCLQLAGKFFPTKPEKIEGIKIDRKILGFHVLHATGWGANPGGLVDDGTLIGSYVLHYEDGKKAIIPIVYGETVRDCWNHDNSKPVKGSTIAWTGCNDLSRRAQKKLRLFRTSWKNPKPEKKIVSVDYTSTNTTAAAPFCLAMTAELK